MARPLPRQLGAAGGRAQGEVRLGPERLAENRAWSSVRSSLLSCLVNKVLTLLSHRLQGRLVPGAAACKVLDEVSVLYTWDRPALFSPIKSARKSDLKLGNTVFLVTRLPATLEDTQAFLGVAQSKIKPKHVVESLLSKRAMAQFTGELNISLHLINTRSDHCQEEVVQVSLSLDLLPSLLKH